jgi:hypothetical protein
MIAEELASRMGKSTQPEMQKLRNFVQGRPSASKLMAEVKSVERLVAEGRHPLHAAYTTAQNYLSVFAELASALRPFKNFTDIVSTAEHDYVPGWPPMSPVSVSFFTGWAFLDLPIGDSGETICTNALALGRAFGMSDDFATTLEVMGESAMGIYQHLGWKNGLVGLRDILTGQEYPCIVPSGHRGAAGELWYVRLLPPLSAAFAHGVAFTSPYVLRDTTPADWLAFFARQETKLPPQTTPEAVVRRRQAFLKRGADPNYWNEYVFLAYHDASDGAIGLHGIPDRPRSLPHGHQRRR